jgi:hypothetical protein
MCEIPFQSAITNMTTMQNFVATCDMFNIDKSVTYSQLQAINRILTSAEFNPMTIHAQTQHANLWTKLNFIIGL